jgi:hypothetical protein
MKNAAIYAHIYIHTHARVVSVCVYMCMLGVEEHGGGDGISGWSEDGMSKERRMEGVTTTLCVCVCDCVAIIIDGSMVSKSVSEVI